MVMRKMVFTCFAVAVLVSALSAQTELINNGTFSNGSTSWYFGNYGGSASGSVINNEYRILVTTAGSEHWHAQFTQSGVPLVQGKTYIFSFDAYKGTQNAGTQTMQVNIGQSNDPYTSYFGNQNQMVTLTYTKTRYTFIVTMTYANDNNARVEFNCGKSTGSFYLDNVSLQEQPQNQPRLSAEPLALDFGTVFVGSSAARTVTVHNAGTATTTVNAVQTSSGQFAVTMTTPFSVAAGNSVTLPVSFTPTAAGSISGDVTVYSNASDNPVITVGCDGVAILPGLSVTPARFDFTSQPGTAVTATMRLANSSELPVNWNLFSSGGWLSVSPTAGSVGAGSGINCTVRANSASEGNFTGTITIIHSADNIPSPVIVPVTFSVHSGYQPTSPYIRDPEQSIDFVRDLAAFRMRQRDNTNGGFYTNIDRQGNSTGANEKALCGQSRIAYAFVRAFMLTGDETYLEYAHHALKFLYQHGWNDGWYFVTDLQGGYVSHWGHNDWWSFQQHYALVGITAMVEATGGTMNWNDGVENDHTWLMRGINSNYTRLWDSNEATKGYFEHANTAWTSKWNKGFTPTVDGVTTHALLMSLMYDSLNHDTRLVELADNIVDHLIASMANAAAGFPEVYTSDWTIDNGNTSMDIGHGYKTAWVLLRAYLMHPEHPEYLTSAQALMQDLWVHGCYDTLHGAPYRYVNWQTGNVTSKDKDFWMVEQGYTAGIMGYYTTDDQTLRDRYMKIADGSINFFMNHMLDPVYGESYAVVSEDGSSIVDGSKGGFFTAGYHAVELGYYAYLYGSLFYRDQPVELYYYYSVAQTERSFRLTPIAIEDEKLKILAMTLDGQPYTDFNTDTREVHLPAGVGGKLKVTFGFTPPVAYTVTATAGSGGAITPSGVRNVTEGSSLTFAISPDTYYRIADVRVDGSSVGTIPSYTFSNIAANHTINATFVALPVYSISASAETGGSITPDGVTQVHQGESQSYAIRVNAGYRIADVLVDGTPVGTDTAYTFSNVTANHTISVTFDEIPVYTITASASAGGTVSPSGNIAVSEGDAQTFNFTPSNGYEVTAVTVDGQAVANRASYTFSNVTANHTIAVAFSIKHYTITATSGAGGSISPSGTITVEHGASQTFNIGVNSGYELVSLSVDGSSVTRSSSYTFTSVTASHTISATFAIISPVVYQINTGSGNNVSPFVSDRYGNGGTMRTVSNSITISGITDPAPQGVYQSERYGNSTYTFPELTPGVEYTVRLHFAELYWTSSGKRRFNVQINGSTVLSNFDIYTATGGRYRAAVREFTVTSNGSGQIVINFQTVTDNATIEGIEILETVPNEPPHILTPAAASPQMVTGTTTALSVLGGDDMDESTLTYTWSTTGSVPAAVSFSANGTNSAKNSTATFTRAGQYTVRVIVRDQGNKTDSSFVTVTVNQTATSMTVSPESTPVDINTTRQFTASVLDQFGVALSTQPSVSWTVNGGGTISSSGLFTAGGSAGGPFAVTATAGNVNATATVTVTEPPSAVYQINTGSYNSYSPFNGDNYGSGGTMRSISNGIDRSGVTDPAPQGVYQSERYGNSTYTLPNLTPNSTYRVRLHFAETYWTSSGKRRFNVVINGSTVISNYDIYAVTGARYKAVVREFTATANGSGQIVINFQTVTDNATIEGIEILR